MPVFAAGRWWTVLSAACLHAGVLHILFNMMAVRQLAPVTAVAGGTRVRGRVGAGLKPAD